MRVTKKRAIEVLKDLRSAADPIPRNAELIGSFDIAIETLEKSIIPKRLTKNRA